MAWYLDNTRIFVVDHTQENKPILAILQPLASGSVYQSFGWESQTRKLRCYVVGAWEMYDIWGKTRDGLPHTLVSPWDSEDYYIKSVSSKHLNTVCQTIDPTKDTDDFVWEVNLDLAKESAL
jgi:hypothetical protein